MWVDGNESPFAAEHVDSALPINPKRKKRKEEAIDEKTQKMLQRVLSAFQTKEREIKELQFQTQMAEREIALVRGQQQIAGGAVSAAPTPTTLAPSAAAALFLFAEDEENVDPTTPPLPTAQPSTPQCGKENSTDKQHTPLTNVTNIIT